MVHSVSNQVNTLFFAHFKHQACHGVDSCITARYKGAGFAGKGLGNGLLNPVHFLCHPRCNGFFLVDQRPDKVHIGCISCNCIGLFYEFKSPASYVVYISRSCSYYKKPVGFRATARVTFPFFIFGTMSCPLFDARIADASHTLFTPKCFSTILDGFSIVVTELRLCLS